MSDTGTTLAQYLTEQSRSRGDLDSAFVGLLTDI
ncbi:MAG: hypothetical protein ACI9UN_005169, partial [Granulosicoccus sp.]